VKTDLDANWHKWSTGQGMKWSTLGGQEVKSEGHKSIWRSDQKNIILSPFGQIGFLFSVCCR